MTALDQLPVGARVVIIRLRSLGDIVLTTPAIALLKAHRPDLHICVSVEPRFRGLLEGNPDVGEILNDDLLAARRARPDLCVNLHGGSRSLKMSLACGLAKTAGFGHFQFANRYGMRIPRAQEILGEERTVHTAEHLASAMFYLGVPRGPIPRARLFTGAESPESGGYAVIHPFASSADKTWNAAGFVSLASRIERDAGLRAVILAGPGEDATPFAGFRVYQSAPLETVKSILQHAAIFVGNDSGPAHMAAAFGVPVVALFGTSDPAIWGPWRTASRVLTGLASISVEDVHAAALDLRTAPALAEGRRA